MITPKSIHVDFTRNGIDKASAVDLLIDLIENSEDIDIRLESIEILAVIDPKSQKLFNFLENLFISDSHYRCRTLAGKILTGLFKDKVLTPMKHALQHERALSCIITILSTLGEINTNESKVLLTRKVKEIDETRVNKYLESLFEEKFIEELTNLELSAMLINESIISSLKLKFGYVSYEIENGAIVKLDLSNADKLGVGITDLEMFLESILSLPLLRELDLKFNNIIKITKNIERSNTLELLDLSYNRITRLPESIGALSCITTLNLKANRFISLPEAIGSLSAMRVLNLRYNKLKSIPKSINSLKNLRILDLHGNKLDKIPELNGLENLIELELGWNDIEDLKNLPQNIGSLPQLKKFSIGGNKINTINSEAIGCLHSLKEFNLYDNNLTTIPDCIGEIKSLEILNLRNNSEINFIPDSIKSLSSLKKLNLSWCSLTELPEWIGELQSLEELNLWGNQIKIIPESIEVIRGNLKILDLKFNKIKAIPSFIKEMEKNGLLFKK